ncbi:MAG TPA: hypothetical protein V6D13_04970 [Halomicronema sp.]
MSLGQPNPNNSEDPNFEQQLAEVEQSLLQLKERYTQIQQDRERQSELLHQQEQLKKQSRLQRDHTFKTQLKQIQEQLESIELNLESSLFSWGSLKEPFWQAVRFTGAGIVVGWILKSLVG